MRVTDIQSAIFPVLLLLSACTSDRIVSPAGQAAPGSEISASKKAPPGIANVGTNSPNTPADPMTNIGLPGFAKVEAKNNDDPATKMAPVRVTDSRLARYTIQGDLSDSTFWLKYGVQGRYTLWISPGYWGYQIVRIEGKDVATLTMQEQTHLFATLPEPIHLVIRSRSGRMQEVEAVTHVDP